MDWVAACQALWRGRDGLTVFDADYGGGAAFRALRQAWQNDVQRSARLHYIALAGDPLPGFRRLPQERAAVTLDLLSAPLDDALGQLQARLDIIVLRGDRIDGHRFAHALGKLARPGALLYAQALTRAQSAALVHAGFVFSEPGRAVYASRRPQPAAAAVRQRRAIVVGAGLAGSAACERLCARGWQVTLVERHPQPACEASGNLAGICMPLLSRDDNLMTRLARAAFRYALDYWETLGADGPGMRCGVLQLARDSAHAEVQRAIAAGRAYPPEFAQWLEAPAASAMLGTSAPDGAWLFPLGGWVRPLDLCGAMLTACGDNLVRRFGAGSVSIGDADGMWQVCDAQGALLAQAPVLILANGNGATSLPQAAHLPLASVRGQVTYLAAGQAPDLPFVLCREAYLTPAQNGVHSLGASYDDDNDPALRSTSQTENLNKVGAMLGGPVLGAGAALAGRVGFRSVAPDRLPLVGALPQALDGAGRIERLRDVPRQPGLFGLLGYASRGLAWAPLAAELLAAQLDGEALPLEAELVQALDPARFVLREQRKASVAGRSKV